jgi:hypothetical protein
MTIIQLPCGPRGPDGIPVKVAVDDFLLAFGGKALVDLISQQHQADNDGGRPVEDIQSVLVDKRVQSVRESGKARGLVYLDRSATGAGKSTADHAAMALAGSSLTILQTHRNCEEKEQELQRLGLDAVAYPRLDKESCGNYDEASTAMEHGLTPSCAVCPTCPLKATCSYWLEMKMAENAAHRIATHKRAELTFDSVADGRRYITIHEDPVDLLRPSASLKDKLNDVAQLAQSISHECLARDSSLAPFFAYMQRAAQWIQDELELAEQTAQLPLPVSTGQPQRADAILFAAMKETGIWPDGDAVRVCKAIAAGKLCSLNVCVDKTLVKGGKPRISRTVTAFWQTQLPSAAIVWISDATADAEEIAAISNLPVLDVTPESKIAARHPIIQVPLDLTKGSSPKSVVRTIRAVINRFPWAKRIGIICDRKHVAAINGAARDGVVLDAATRARVVRIEHFRGGEGRASNSWTSGEEKCDLLVVAGTPRVPPAAIKYRLLQRDKAEAAARSPEWVSWEKDWWSGRTVSGSRRTVQTLAYRDRDWHAAYAQIVRSELRQCVGRARSIRLGGIPAVVITTDELGFRLIDEDVYVVRDAEQRLLEAIAKLSDLVPTAQMTDAHRTYLLNSINLATRSVSSVQIAGHLGLSDRVVRRALVKLEKAHLVNRLGERGGWYLTERGCSQAGLDVDSSPPVPPSRPEPLVASTAPVMRPECASGAGEAGISDPLEVPAEF